jgi:Protein of unknown function (DUF2975)
MATLHRFIPLSQETTAPLPHPALQAKIAWLCHLTRAAAVGWVVWMLITVLWVWSDPAKVVGAIGHYLNADLGAISASEFTWAFGVNIIVWIGDAAVAYCIWRLFGVYLGGRIFKSDAAIWLQRIGTVGLVVVLVSITARRIVWLILTRHAELPLGTRFFSQLVVPVDLLEVLFCLFVLAMGRVFVTAVEIADDNASFV